MKFVAPPFSMVRSSVLMVALSLTYGCNDSDARRHVASAAEDISPTIHRSVKIGPQHDVSRTRGDGFEGTLTVDQDAVVHAGFKLAPLPDAEPSLFEREAIMDVEDTDTDYFADAQALMEEERVEDARALLLQRRHPCRRAVCCCCCCC